MFGRGKKKGDNGNTDQSVPIPQIPQDNTQTGQAQPPQNGWQEYPYQQQQQPYYQQNGVYPAPAFQQGVYPTAVPFSVGYAPGVMPAAQQQNTQRPPQGNTGFESFSPTNFSDVAKILTKIKERAVVLVNVSKLSREERVRIMDMISGAIYVLGGNISTIQDNLYSVTPGAGV